MLRKLAGFSTREWDYGHRARVTTVEVENSHQATAWQCFLPTGPLAFLPLPEIQGRHYCSIVWSVDEALADDSIKAVVIRCDGRTFFAGADITEFGKPPQGPSLTEAIDRLRAL